MIVPRLWLAFLAVAFALCVYFSDRDWSLTNMPRIEALGDVDARPELADAIGPIQSEPGLLPYTAAQRAERDQRGDVGPDRMPSAKIGYAYRELSILRLPIWGYADQGMVMFFETPEGYYFVPLAEEQVQAVDRVLGTSHAGYGFPFWKHMWGWLFLIGLIVWTFLHLRAGARLAAQEEAEESGEAAPDAA